MVCSKINVLTLMQVCARAESASAYNCQKLLPVTLGNINGPWLTFYIFVSLGHSV